MQSTISNAGDDTTAAFSPLRESHWWTWAIRGLIAIVFGVLAFVWPGATITSLIWVFGVYAILDGGLALVGAAV